MVSRFFLGEVKVSLESKWLCSFSEFFISEWEILDLGTEKALEPPLDMLFVMLSTLELVVVTEEEIGDTGEVDIPVLKPSVCSFVSFKKVLRDNDNGGDSETAGESAYPFEKLSKVLRFGESSSVEEWCVPFGVVWLLGDEEPWTLPPKDRDLWSEKSRGEEDLADFLSRGERSCGTGFHLFSSDGRLILLLIYNWSW